MRATALGEHVILSSTPACAGDEIKSEFGIIVGKHEQGQLPETCTVYDIGPDVPKGIIYIGDVTSLPTGSMRNVPHPDVVRGIKTPSDCREKLVAVHYKNLPCVYRD